MNNDNESMEHLMPKQGPIAMVGGDNVGREGSYEPGDGTGVDDIGKLLDFVTGNKRKVRNGAKYAPTNDILSICITVKDRSVQNESYGTSLPEVINRICNIVGRNSKVEIIIADWCSTDKPLREWMGSTCKKPFRVVYINEPGFSKGKGLNECVKVAKGDTLMFLDADVIMTDPKFIGELMSTVARGEVYIPIVKYIEEYGVDPVRKLTGNIGMSKSLFNKVGGFPEYYRYGFEDIDFIKDTSMHAKLNISNNQYLLHPYHDQSMAFKERYKTDNVEHDKEIHARSVYYEKAIK